MEEAVSMMRPEPRFFMRSRLIRRRKISREEPVVVGALVRENLERSAEVIAENDRGGDTALVGKGLSMARIVKRRNTIESSILTTHN